MENKKENEEAVKEFYRGVAKPVNSKVLKETYPNSRTITKEGFKKWWRPHNYRRQCNCKTLSNSVKERLGDTIVGAKFIKHTKLLFLSNYRGGNNITLQIGKTSIVAIWNQNIIDGRKETYLVEAGSRDVIEKFLYGKKEEIRSALDSAIRDFMRSHNLELPLEYSIWGRYEDWSKGDEYVSKLDKECIVHADLFKKVYDEGIETQGGKGEEPTEKIVRHIHNSFIHDIAPEIAGELSAMRGTFQGFLDDFIPVMKEHTANIKSHTGVVIEMAKSHKRFTSLLEIQEAREKDRLSKKKKRKLRAVKNSVSLNRWT